MRRRARRRLAEPAEDPVGGGDVRAHQVLERAELFQEHARIEVGPQAAELRLGAFAPRVEELDAEREPRGLGLPVPGPLSQELNNGGDDEVSDYSPGRVLPDRRGRHDHQRRELVVEQGRGCANQRGGGVQEPGARPEVAREGKAHGEGEADAEGHGERQRPEQHAVHRLANRVGMETVDPGRVRREEGRDGRRHRERPGGGDRIAPVQGGGIARRRRRFRRREVVHGTLGSHWCDYRLWVGIVPEG